jgi:hypothetical protein
MKTHGRRFSFVVYYGDDGRNILICPALAADGLAGVILKRFKLSVLIGSSVVGELFIAPPKPPSVLSFYYVNLH